MIAKVDKMNMRQENHEEGQETKNMLKNQKESEPILLQMKATLNDHRDTSLSEILPLFFILDFIFFTGVAERANS